MSPHPNIHPVVPADIPTIGDLLLRSKLALTINRLVWLNWPNEPAQREQYTSTVKGGHENPDCEDFKYVDPETGAIVGYIIVKRITAPPVDSVAQDGKGESAGAERMEILPTMNETVVKGVLEAVEKVENGWGKMDRLDVVFVVVEQAERRKGIGRQLMDVCFEKAREAKLPIATSVEPAAVKFFQELGFEDAVSADMDLSKWAQENEGFGMFRLRGMIHKGAKK